MAKAPPPPAEAAANLVQGAQARSQKYVSRSTAAAPRWASMTQQAGPAWTAGVTTGNPVARYLSKTQRAGAAGYTRGITDKGSARFGPGVAAAQDKYTTNVTPYFNAIAAAPQAPRGTRGSPVNIQRVQQIADALHNLRVGGAAARG